MTIIKKIHEPIHEEPVAECCLIEGAAFVNQHQPHNSKTFGEYCEKEVKQNIYYILKKVSHFDLVFDVY